MTLEDVKILELSNPLIALLLPSYYQLINITRSEGDSLKEIYTDGQISMYLNVESYPTKPTISAHNIIPKKPPLLCGFDFKIARIRMILFGERISHLSRGESHTLECNFITAIAIDER